MNLSPSSVDDESAAHVLVQWLTDHPGTSVDDAQKALNWTKPQLAKAMTDDARRLAVRRRTGSSRKWSEAELLDRREDDAARLTLVEQFLEVVP